MRRNVPSACVLTVCLAVATGVCAQGALPWEDTPPRVEAEDVVCAALGQSDHRVRDWSARRLSARRRGAERARRMLHRWVDDALARIAAPPHVAVRVHRLVDDAAVRRVRPLVDGSAVVVIGVPRAALRRVAALAGVPW